MTMSLPAGWPRYRSPQERRRHRAFVMMATAVVVGVAAGGVAEILASPGSGAPSWGPAHPIVIALPDRPTSYIGAYARGVPDSYAPMNSFGVANGVQPNIAMYYSWWGEPFKSAFAVTAAAHHAVPLVQIDPGDVSVASIAAGRYDSYLQAFAEAVGDFGQQTRHGVIIGFGHAPGGFGFAWGYRHLAPGIWIQAWRHIVTLFRTQGADDVTWLWTVNVISTKLGIVSLRRWWPGPKYVTWVGVDGYYDRRSAMFASLFGPTITAIRRFTSTPILVAGTGVRTKAGQLVKIADVFRGVSAYRLLGLVWFNVRDSRLDSPASAAAFASAARSWRLTSG